MARQVSLADRLLVCVSFDEGTAGIMENHDLTLSSGPSWGRCFGRRRRGVCLHVAV